MENTVSRSAGDFTAPFFATSVHACGMTAATVSAELLSALVARVGGQRFIDDPGWRAVVEQVGLRPFDPVSGILKGFIDLVFRLDGKFYIADWKSNWLGGRVEDYHADAMRAEMERHHYFLQYHLYTVALHKYLALRLPDYDYAKHFGGVFYVFLRGLEPARPDLGIFRDRPSVETIQRLSELLGGNP